MERQWRQCQTPELGDVGDRAMIGLGNFETGRLRWPRRVDQRFMALLAD